MALIACPKAARAKTIRVGRLDNCGRPYTATSPNSAGTAAVVQTGSFIEMKVTPDVEAGQELLVKNSAGEICAKDKVVDEIKGFDIALKLCGVPFPLLNMMVGVRQINDPVTAGNIIGGALPTGKIVRDPLAIGVWLRNITKGTCPDPALGPNALPFVQFQLTNTRNWVPDGDMNFANGELELNLKGYAQENPNFGIGPAIVGGSTTNGNLSPWVATDNAVEALLWKAVGVAPTVSECQFLDAA